MKRRILPILLISAMLLLALPTAASADGGVFADVSSDDYFASAVRWAVAWGVTNGTSETTFSPERICTRAQVVTFLWRAHGEPEPKSSYNPFTDVPKGSYYERSTLWALEEGITTGTSDEPMLFSPNKPCTYAQILTFIWRAKGSQTPAFASPLTEGWPESYYKDAVTWADNNAMLEDEGEEIDPNRPCSRGRTVAWLWREAQVYASDAAGLMSLIGPGREIHLAPGVYDLTEWVEQIMTTDGQDTGNPYVSLSLVNDGYEIVIRGVRNMSINTDGFLTAGTVELVVEPRYANVLTFVDCDQIVLSGMTMGHTPDRGYCTGAVLCFRECGRVALSEMDLYGCGTYGITGDRVESIQTVDSVIRDCSYGILDLYSVKDAGFGDCVFYGCDGFDMLYLHGSGLTFQSCIFTDNHWNEINSHFLSMDQYSDVTFRSCTFDRPTYFDLTGGSLEGKSVLIEAPTVLSES